MEILENKFMVWKILCEIQKISKNCCYKISKKFYYNLLIISGENFRQILWKIRTLFGEILKEMHQNFA